MSIVARCLRLSACALGLLLIAGCGGGVDNSDFSKTPGVVPADAPKTAAEYDAKYPVPNAGDAKGKAAGPRGVTNP